MGKKGNKDRNRQARQQKRLAKRQAARASARFNLPGRKRGDRDPPGLADFSDQDHLFWVAHGINYIASDYDEGVWKPLFPEVYEGDLPEEEALARRVMDTFAADLEQEGASPGKTATAWAVQDKATVFVFQQKALEQYKQGSPDDEDPKLAICQPHVGAVWRVFEELKAQIQRRA
jgi:hypothetical protein